MPLPLDFSEFLFEAPAISDAPYEEHRLWGTLLGYLFGLLAGGDRDSERYDTGPWWPAAKRALTAFVAELDLRGEIAREYTGGRYARPFDLYARTATSAHFVEFKTTYRAPGPWSLPRAQMLALVEQATDHASRGGGYASHRLTYAVLVHATRRLRWDDRGRMRLEVSRASEYQIVVITAPLRRWVEHLCVKESAKNLRLRVLNRACLRGARTRTRAPRVGERLEVYSAERSRFLEGTCVASEAGFDVDLDGLDRVERFAPGAAWNPVATAVVGVFGWLPVEYDAEWPGVHSTLDTWSLLVEYSDDDMHLYLYYMAYATAAAKDRLGDAWETAAADHGIPPRDMDRIRAICALPRPSTGATWIFPSRNPHRLFETRDAAGTPRAFEVLFDARLFERVTRDDSPLMEILASAQSDAPADDPVEASVRASRASQEYRESQLGRGADADDADAADSDAADSDAPDVRAARDELRLLRVRAEVHAEEARELRAACERLRGARDDARDAARAARASETEQSRLAETRRNRARALAADLERARGEVHELRRRKRRDVDATAQLRRLERELELHGTRTRRDAEIARVRAEYDALRLWALRHAPGDRPLLDLLASHASARMVEMRL